MKKDEEYWSPDGEGYLLVKQHFEVLQKLNKFDDFISHLKKSCRKKSCREKSLK